MWFYLALFFFSVLISASAYTLFKTSGLVRKTLKTNTQSIGHNGHGGCACSSCRFGMAAIRRMKRMATNNIESSMIASTTVKLQKFSANCDCGDCYSCRAIAMHKKFAGCNCGACSSCQSKHDMGCDCGECK